MVIPQWVWVALAAGVIITVALTAIILYHGQWTITDILLGILCECPLSSRGKLLLTCGLSKCAF